MEQVKIEKIPYLGWDNCIKISNGTVDLIVTADVGPRIIHYGFCGGFNHMKVFDEQAGKTGAGEWQSYGGHRLWHSPESMPRTYDRDNSPCEWKAIKNGIAIRSSMDPWVQLDKEMEIRLSPKGTKVTINHRITNRNAWDAEFAVWSLTVMAEGGRLVIPMPDSGPKLLPNRNITLWTYTMMNDSRVHWLDRYIFLDQDSRAKRANVPSHRKFAKNPFKIGMAVPDGWAAYINHGEMFLKRFEYCEDELYPDSGFCNFETYTNTDMIEIETLSPLRLVEPGQSVTHKEEWQLIDKMEKPETEADADNRIVPLI